MGCDLASDIDWMSDGALSRLTPTFRKAVSQPEGACSLGAADLMHPRQLRAQHLPIKKKRSVERLPVRGGRYLVFGGQHGQEILHLGLPHLARVSEAIATAGSPQHKGLGAVDVNLLRL